MDTARLQSLSEKCEALKYMCNRLTSLSDCQIALLYDNSDGVDCRLDSATTKNLKNDLQHLLDVQVRTCEDEIKNIITEVKNV